MNDINKKYLEAKQKQAEAHKLTGIKDSAHKNRLPPGQVLTQSFPILDLGIRPSREEYGSWAVKVWGEIKNPKTYSLADIKKFPKTERTLDFHCVTRWSRFDITWGGILFTDLLDSVNPESSVKDVIFHSYDNYTTNVPCAELLTKNVLIAYELETKEIPPEHGGPVRMIIPTLYGWKSAKFLTGIQFLNHDEPGFWEVRGYNNHGDPWLEERYS